MEYLYYILDNTWCSDSLDDTNYLEIRIIAISNNISFPELTEGDGPYKSIRNLKRNSPIFIRLAKMNSKYVQKILAEKNIHFIKDFVQIPKGKLYSKDFIKLIDHTTNGHIKDKKVFGMHYYDESKMRLKEVINPENKYGVWKAKIDVFNKINNVWIEKKKVTTFFPKNWTLNQLFHECDYAYANKLKDTSSISKYISKTISDVKVEIIIKDGVVKSIYPIYE